MSIVDTMCTADDIGLGPSNSWVPDEEVDDQIERINSTICIDNAESKWNKRIRLWRTGFINSGIVVAIG